MPRKSTFTLPGLPKHIVHRASQGALWFFQDDDRRHYLKYLCDACAEHSCDVHAYVLMPDHVHLLMTPHAGSGEVRLMLALDHNYVGYILDRYRRTDTSSCGRLTASIIDRDVYFLACSRDIEMHPVRAGMAIRPGDYVWSSYRSNALGMENDVLTPHHSYLALGRQRSKRRVRYRKLFEPGPLAACSSPQ